MTQKAVSKFDKTSCLQQFDRALGVLASQFPRLEDSLPKPVPTKTPQGWVPRYNPPLIEHAVLQKFARMISLLAAMRALVAGGFMHEQGILQRASDETGDDIAFLVFGKQNGLTPLHEQFLEIFWREEFTTGSNPAEYQQREMIPRKKIRRYINETFAPATSATANAVGKMLYGVFSGFVHGASTQIFELLNRRTLKFELFGFEPNENSHGYYENAMNYPLRVLMAGVLVARSLGSAQVASTMFDGVKAYEIWLKERKTA